MPQSHLRDLHEINRKHPSIDMRTFFRELHFQRLDEIEAEDAEPSLLFHIFPESLHDGNRLFNLEEVEQILVPGMCRSQYDVKMVSKYPTSYWDRVTATFENHRDLVSNSILYDTGMYETVGSALCYPVNRGNGVDYAVSSQDLEQSLVAMVQSYRDLLPSDYGGTVYFIGSGVNLDNATMDQYRRVEQVKQFSDDKVTSRLTSIDLNSDDGLRDQLSPVLRPFWFSQTWSKPNLYFNDDGDWEFADNLD